MHNAFRNVKKLPTKCDCNTNPHVITIILEDYFIQLDMKVNAKNQELLLSFISVLLTRRTPNISQKHRGCVFPANCTNQLQFLE